MPYLDASTPEEIPNPNASLVCSRVIVEAWLMSVSRKQGKRFLENLATVIESREEMAHIIPMQRRTRDASRVEREALAALRQMIAVWLMRLPPR